MNQLHTATQHRLLTSATVYPGKNLGSPRSSAGARAGLTDSMDTGNSGDHHRLKSGKGDIQRKA